MRKKVLLGFIATFFTMSLVGCSDEKKESIETTGVSQKQVSDKKKKTESLEISKEDLENVLSFDSEDSFAGTKKFTQSNGVLVESFLNDIKTVKVLSYYTSDYPDTPFAVVATCKKDNEYARDTVLRIQSDIEEKISKKNHDAIAKTEGSTEDGRYLAAVKLVDSPEIYSSFKDLAKDDILSKEDKYNEIDNYIKNQNYQELNAVLKEYIRNETPSEYDFSYDLDNTLKANESFLDKLIVEKDSIENKTTVFFDEKQAISQEINAVPYLDNSGTLKLDIGFIKNDWLFTKDVIFHIDNEESLNINSSDYKRNVLEGGLVEEKASISYLTDEVMSKLKSANQITIRFKGEKGDYDRQLPAETVLAINNLAKISGTKRELSDLIFLYKTL